MWVSGFPNLPSFWTSKSRPQTFLLDHACKCFHLEKLEKLCGKLKFEAILNSWEICCAFARFPLKLEDFPEEITKCSWLLYNFECLFNLYNFFARDKDKVKCTLRFQCIEYLVCV